MPVNIDKPQNWKSDITKSVDMYTLLTSEPENPLVI